MQQHRATTALLSADEAWADPAIRKLYIKLVLGLLVGTALEFYDFAVYSQLGKYVGPNFFPAGNVHAEQLSFWAAYAVAFVVRPLGALLFGHCADRHSRKTSLVYSLMMMAAPTTLIGCLPTYQHISWAAPVLLVLFRLVQGLAIGGENGTAIVYLYELAPSSHRGLVVAVGWSGVPLGVLLGIAVVLILTESLSPAAMMLYGWRIAFLLGACTGFVAVLLRRRMPDPAVFLQRKHEIEEQLDAAGDSSAGVIDAESARMPAAKDSSVSGSRARDMLVQVETGDAASKPKQLLTRSSSGLPDVHLTGKHFWPVLEMLRCYWRPVFLQWTWEFWFSAAFYCFCSYMPSFLAANVPGMTRAMSLVSTMVHLVFVGGVAIATGCYSDRGGPRMILSAVVHLLGGAALAPAALAIRYGGVVAAWLVPLAFQILVGTFGGLLAVSMCPLYPPEVRSSGMNFAHQMAVGPIGGLTPIILAATNSVNGDVFMAMVPWLAACAAVSLISTAVLYFKYPQSNKDVSSDCCECRQGSSSDGVQLRSAGGGVC